MKLTQQMIPTGSLLGWVSDVHIGIEHTPALRLMCEAWEWVGVTHAIAGGDILDLHCLSRHEKDPDRVLRAGTLLTEVESGRWFLNWLATRPCEYLLGNHEGRLDRWVAENALALYGNSAVAIQSLAKIPAGIRVHPVGSELRLGNLVLTHGDNELKSGGGKYPANKLLDMAPDQSTICGHVHRETMARRSTRDEDGIKRTRAAWTMGHMSIEHKHHDYVSRHVNWQMGWGLIYVWWDGNRPRWDVTQVEVHFDKRGRPYFALRGKVFQ